MMDADAVLMFSSEDLSPFGSLNEVWMLNLRPSRAYCVLIIIRNKTKKGFNFNSMCDQVLQKRKQENKEKQNQASSFWASLNVQRK